MTSIWCVRAGQPSLAAALAGSSTMPALGVRSSMSAIRQVPPRASAICWTVSWSPRKSVSFVTNGALAARAAATDFLRE